MGGEGGKLGATRAQRNRHHAKQAKKKDLRQEKAPSGEANSMKGKGKTQEKGQKGCKEGTVASTRSNSVQQRLTELNQFAFSFGNEDISAQDEVGIIPNFINLKTFDPIYKSSQIYHH